VSEATENIQPGPDAIAYAELNPAQQRQRLVTLAAVFARLGVIAFGGPAAHIAMMDDEIVKRRQWMDRERLLDLLGITQLIPGPNSTELAIHIGYDRAGWKGLLVAGISFILPAMLIVWALAAIYGRYQTVPQVEWLLYGIKPVIMAVVLQAVWQLGKKAAKSVPTTLAGVLAIAAYFVGLNEILVLVLLGCAVMLLTRWQAQGNPSGIVLLPLSGSFLGTFAETRFVETRQVTPIATFVGWSSVGWPKVFWAFLKIGSVLYGSGYVLLAFLQRDLVERNHWLTSQQLLDAVAIGQLTPGPVLTTATFIGYLLAGNAGAIAATIGIFLPAFVLVLIVHPWVPKLRASPWARGFLDGVNAASLGLMAGVAWTLGQAALVDGVTVGLAVAGAIAVFRFKINTAGLVLAGALVGFLVQFF
jgi:chromate transporter